MPVTGVCTPGLIGGFDKAVRDAVTRVVRTTGGEGAEGSVGGDGDGGVGVGIGGADGQYTNVDVTVEFASGEIFGPTRVDAQKGMVTLVPCSLQPPALITFTGAPGSGATYYDEFRRLPTSFEGQTRRGLVRTFSRNAGVTLFTEALFQRASALADFDMTAGGFRLKVVTKADDAWRDPARVQIAHDEILRAVNDLMPESLRLTDLTRLPVALNPTNDVVGSSAFSNDQNSRYGAVISSMVQLAGRFAPGSASPGLDIANQVATDFRDGQLDRRNFNELVSPVEAMAYTVDSLWQANTLLATATTIDLGDASVDSSAVIVPVATIQNGGVVLFLYSNGQLVYGENCDGQNCAQAKLLATDIVEVKSASGANDAFYALKSDRKQVLGWNFADVAFGFVPTAGNDGQAQVFDLAQNGTSVTWFTRDTTPTANLYWRLSNGTFFRLNPTTNAQEPITVPNGTLSLHFGAQPFERVYALLADGRILAITNPGLAAAPGAGGGNLVLSEATAVAVAGADYVQIGTPSPGGGLLGRTASGEVFWINAKEAVVAQADGTLLDAGGNPTFDSAAVARMLDVFGTTNPACHVNDRFIVGCDGSIWEIQDTILSEGDSSYIQNRADPLRSDRFGELTQWRSYSALSGVNPANASQIRDSVAVVTTTGTLRDSNGAVVTVPPQTTGVAVDPNATVPEPPSAPAPQAPVISVIAGNDAIDASEAAQGIQVSGSAQVNSRVSVTWGSTVKGTDTDSSGAWAIAFLSSELPSAGPSTVSATATTGAGTSPAATRRVVIDAPPPPAPVIAPITGDNLISLQERTGAITVTGSARAGDMISVTLAGVSRSATAGSDGAWSVQYAATEIPASGPVNVSAQSSLNGLTGGAATVSVAIEVPAPPPSPPSVDAVTGDNRIDTSEQAAGVNISGRAIVGGGVRISWGQTTKTSTVDANGNWVARIEPGEIPPPGDTLVTAVVSTQAGDSSPVSIAVVVETPALPIPTPPIIDVVSTDDILTDVELTSEIAITGTAQPGVTVNVTWESASKSTSTDSGGFWQVSFSPAESPAVPEGGAGSSEISAQAVNQGQASTLASRVVQLEATVVETTATISGIFDDDDSLIQSGDTIYEPAGFLVLEGSISDPLDSSEVVAIYRNGVRVGEGEVDSSGGFRHEITGLTADLSYEFTARVENVASQHGPESAEYIIVYLTTS